MYVPRCADAAVLLVGSCEADSGEPRCTPAVMDLVASSQGSPIISPPPLMLPLLQIDEPNGLGELGEACASLTTTPASSTVTRASCCFFNLYWELSVAFACFLRPADSQA